MSGEEPTIKPTTRNRVAYGIMLLSGAVFVSTLALPVSDTTAQLIAALSFGLMSGLWLGHLIYSV